VFLLALVVLPVVALPGPTFPQLGSAPVASTYDSFGRLSGVTAPWGTTQVEWERGGQRLTRLGAEAFGYDGRGWLSTVTTATRVTTYTSDGRGNRTREVVTGASALAGERRFAYDDADRLVAAQEWDGHVEAWALAPDGTRAEAKRWAAGTPWPVAFTTANPTTWQTYGYGNDGVLETVTDVVTGVVDLRYAHDSNGQVTGRTEGGVTTTFTWGVDGRLESASRPRLGAAPALSATYQYDALGMRRSAEVTLTPLAPAPPVTTTRSWTWGGADGEEEEGEDFNVTTSVGGFRVGDGVASFTHDGLGSVVTQSDGVSTNDARFDAWGTRTALGSNIGPLASSAGFTGHRLEDALGFSYAKRRWLDSSTGTWLSHDDIGAASYLQSPNELNPHLYAAGNPTRFIDADGRREQTIEEQLEIGQWRALAWKLRVDHAALLASQSSARRWLTNSPVGTGPRFAQDVEVLERNIRSRERAIEGAADGVPVVEGAEGALNIAGVSPYREIRFAEATAASGEARFSLPLWPNWHPYYLSTRWPRVQ